MRIISLAIFIILAGSVSAQSPKWLEKFRQIKLLVSNRDDVIKLYGKPIGSMDSYGGSFKTKYGLVGVIYSFGDCKIDKNGWDVPKWTVIDMTIEPKKPIKPSEIGVDLSRMNFIKEYDTPNLIYEDEKKGESYVVFNGKITAINYYPSEKYDHLLCSSSKNK